MNKMTFTKLIANYFVPYTSGKFIASCLMLSPEVYPMLKRDELFDRLVDTEMSTWSAIEYSDVDFWWKDSDKDWFNTAFWNWGNIFSDSAKTALSSGQYVFYSVHESHTLDFFKYEFPKLNILTIVPDETLCRKNYELKSPESFDGLPFDESRIKQELESYRQPETDLVFYQKDIYDKEKFVAGISRLASNLGITVDMDLVLAYRDAYLSNRFNQI